MIDVSLAPFLVPAVFLFLLLAGAPIAVVLGFTGLSGLLLFGDPVRIASTAVGRSISQAGLLAIPYYVLAGVLLEKSGIARALLRFFMALIGHFRGGIVVMTGGTSIVFGGISGSGPADVAALSLVFVPPMEERGYSRAFGAALCAAGGSLGLILPPSAGYILYALITQRASIVDLFIGGIVPGLLMATGFVVAGLIAASRSDIRKDPRSTMREIVAAAPGALAGIGAPALILGGIYGGIFTVTEAAGIAVLYAAIVGGAVFRELKWPDLVEIAIRTGVATGVIFFIVAAASIFARLVSISGWAVAFSNWLSGFATTPLAFVLMAALIVFICGFFIDGISMYFILVPLMLPGIDAFGIDPVYFGIVVTMAVAIGLITPPLGLDLYAAAGVIDVSIESMARAAIPLVIGAMIATLLVIFFPVLTQVFL